MQGGKALEIIHGSYAYSYGLIPELRKELLKSNLGSVVQYVLDVDHSFQRLFICLEACRMGFIKGCRPFLGLDGCHLKESGDSWKWFLQNLQSALRMIEGLVFMSDKDKGLESVVPLVYHMWNTGHMLDIFTVISRRNTLARHIPIIDMVETIRQKIMERMDHRRGLGRKWKGKFVPKAFKYVQHIVKDIGEYIVRRSSDVMAEVVGPDFTVVVRFNEKTCT
ncbi:hypothetical protein QJS10_CPA09g01140 [Acorus calamus]|uniref:Uncharacterized protein n=1 Tax=Acorus calamus TaxID=4465 RepID=A0AAV9E5S1_ACOCL|nr:hypothetical protein QJS10_CPA09g01140 [Acorus calamus]